MTKQYITISKSSDLDWRLRAGRSYEVVGSVGKFYFVWANGHQSLVQPDRIAKIETVKVANEGGETWVESKRARQKRTGHSRS